MFFKKKENAGNVWKSVNKSSKKRRMCRHVCDLAGVQWRLQSSQRGVRNEDRSWRKWTPQPEQWSMTVWFDNPVAFSMSSFNAQNRKYPMIVFNHWSAVTLKSPRRKGPQSGQVSGQLLLPHWTLGHEVVVAYRTTALRRHCESMSATPCIRLILIERCE